MWDGMTPVEEVVRALDDLVRAGKVLYVGASDTPAWAVARAVTLAELRGWAAFCGLQLPWSLADRSVERELLPLAAALDLAVTPWGVLESGELTGKYLGPRRPAHPLPPRAGQPTGQRAGRRGHGRGRRARPPARPRWPSAGSASRSPAGRPGDPDRRRPQRRPAGRQPRLPRRSSSAPTSSTAWRPPRRSSAASRARSWRATTSAGWSSARPSSASPPTAGPARTPAGRPRRPGGPCGAGRWGGGRGSSRSIWAHQAYSQSTWASRSVGTSAAGTRHQRALRTCSMGRARQTSPTVTTCSRPVWATKITSAVGAASIAARAPPGLGGSRCSMALALAASSARRRSSSSRMARSRRRGVKLPPSGKITRAPVGPRPAASRSISRMTRLPGSPPGRDEGVGQAVDDHVEAGVELEGGLHHDPGLAPVAAEQVVDEQERVAGAGVAAEHDHRPGQAGAWPPRGSAPAPRSRCAAGRCGSRPGTRSPATSASARSGAPGRPRSSAGRRSRWPPRGPGRRTGPPTPWPARPARTRAAAGPASGRAAAARRPRPGSAARAAAPAGRS